MVKFFYKGINLMARTRKREPVVFKVRIEPCGSDMPEASSVKHWAWNEIFGRFCNGKTLRVLIDDVEVDYSVQVHDCNFGPNVTNPEITVSAYRKEYSEAGDYEWQFDET